MSAQNSSTQAPAQDTHKRIGYSRQIFPDPGARSIRNRGAHVRLLLPQIIGNINGHKGDWIQPLVAGINCTLWVAYGLWREKKTGPL